MSHTWQGSVLASGFVLDEALVDRATLVKRLLSAWADGARLGRAGSRWFLVGLPPRQVDSRVCIGSPLVSAEGRWLMGPVTKEVLRAAPVDSILECVAGERCVTHFATLTAVHPSELVEIKTPSVLEVTLLTPPPQAVVTQRAQVPTLESVFAPMMQALGPAPRPAELAALQRPIRPTMRARWGAWLAARRAAAATTPSVGARLGSFFAALTRRSSRPPPQPEARQSAPNVRQLRAPPPAPRGPTWLDRFTDWLSPPAPPRAPTPGPRIEQAGWLADAFRRFFTPKPNPDKQREYLEDLRRRFGAGDLGEALRRAVPLGGSGGFGEATGLIPGRREELSLLGPNASGPPSMVMPTDEYASMKKLYRESADVLIAKGQIEEAAYVLARLLNDGAAAVALLEKHGKLELAAQLATAQHLPEVDRIRLWLLAGRKEEAIRIARGSNDFGALVQALTPRAPELALELRSVWAEFLADRQRYTEAIVVTAPLAALPERWEEWVTRALEAGGASAATALAVDAARHPEHAQQTRERVNALLTEDEGARLTTTTAEAFLVHAPTSSGPLYRDLWRRLMRGASAGHRVERALADRVMKASGDQTLVIDAVASALMPAAGAREPLVLAAPVVPGLPVFDVAPLPKNRRALALGAAGLHIISSSGQTVRHLLVKADLLVAGPVGVGVLVLSLDGDLTTCWKLDPRTLALTSWFQARLPAVSRRYDGLCWAVGMEDALVFLDPSAPSAMEWWRVPHFECRAIDANGSRVIALGTDRALKESWRSVFNAGTERMQTRYSPDLDCWVRGETVFTWHPRLGEDGLLKVGTREYRLPHAQWTTFPTDTGLVLTRVTEGDTEVRLVRWSEGEPVVLALLSRTTAVRCRDLSPTQLALCDEHGRVTELDLS